MIYTVVKAENKTAKTGKPYKSLTISDGPTETNVNIFSDFPDFANIKVSSQIDGHLEANGKYQNLKSNAIKERPRANFDRIIEKKQAGIVESQERKASNISQAQDRNEVMWAKYSASEIVAHHPAYKNLKDEVEVEMAIEALASKILHMSCTPF